jgi:hypothetical protein
MLYLYMFGAKVQFLGRKMKGKQSERRGNCFSLFFSMQFLDLDLKHTYIAFTKEKHIYIYIHAE